MFILQTYHLFGFTYKIVFHSLRRLFGDDDNLWTSPCEKQTSYDPEYIPATMSVKPHLALCDIIYMAVIFHSVLQGPRKSNLNYD